MKTAAALIFAFLIIWSAAPGPGKSATNDPGYAPIREVLIKKGLPSSYLDQVFTSNKIKVQEEVAERFRKPYEKKSYAEYRKLFVTDKRISHGSKFYGEHKKDLQAVADSFNVDPVLILSIIGVESNFGTHHEDFSVFNALYSVIQLLPQKADWAQNQLVEFLLYCYKDKMDPHSIYGSYAGAFGYGQFIPSSFNGYAVDFDRNGIRNPYDWQDTFASVANYLRKNGYHAGEKTFSRKSSAGKAVWAYNHSTNYVRAVLELRAALKKAI